MYILRPPAYHTMGISALVQALAKAGHANAAVFAALLELGQHRLGKELGRGVQFPAVGDAQFLALLLRGQKVVERELLAAWNTKIRRAAALGTEDELEHLHKRALTPARGGHEANYEGLVGPSLP